MPEGPVNQLSQVSHVSHGSYVGHGSQLSNGNLAGSSEELYDEPMIEIAEL